MVGWGMNEESLAYQALSVGEEEKAKGGTSRLAFRGLAEGLV